MKQFSNDEQKKLAIIGASYLQEPLVRKAKEMGLYTICFAWAEGAVCSEVCDKFYDISIVEKEQILEICQKEKINGIATIASDVAAPTVAYIAERMGLVGNSYEVAVRANNKYLMREALNKGGCPSLVYHVVKDMKSVDELKYIKFREDGGPMDDWIVKPTDRSGSLCINHVHNLEELSKAIQSAIEVSFKKEAIVEEFIKGREFSVEGLSYKGRHEIIQITDKVTEEEHFIEIAHHQPSNLTSNIQEEIKKVVCQSLRTLGITNGASHTELKVTTDGKIKIIEIGARMGGGFIGSDLVQLSTGFDYVHAVIEIALGVFDWSNFENIKKTPFNKCSGVYFLIPQTKFILPYLLHPEKYPFVVKAALTNPDIPDTNSEGGRSGYFIYQSDKRIEL